MKDWNIGIRLLVASVRDDEGARLIAEVGHMHSHLPVIIAAWAAYPVGIHERTATLLEPVDDAELVAAATVLLSQRAR
jgi:hypothetical protein